MSTPRRRTAAKEPETRPGGALLRSPILLLTAGAGLGAIAVILILAIAGGGLGGLFGARATPPTGTPAPGATARPAPSVSIEPYVAPSYTKPAELAFGRSLGSPDAPVKVDIWIDYQCPACRQFNQAIEPQLVDAYITTGKIRFNVRDFAFLGDESIRAAVAARCADQQGQFWPYHELLFANQAPENSGALNENRLLQFAAVLGLDTAAFTACMQDQQVIQAVGVETGDGSRLPVIETPYVLVNDVVVRPASDFNLLSATIENALAGATPGTAPSP